MLRFFSCDLMFYFGLIRFRYFSLFIGGYVFVVYFFLFYDLRGLEKINFILRVGVIYVYFFILLSKIEYYCYR